MIGDRESDRPSSGRCRKLLLKAENNPRGLRFSELCRLAGCHGFRLVRRRGSHLMYRHDGLRRVLSFQDDGGGGAKSYQVKELLSVIWEWRRGHA